jgi:hypothetical protein
VEAAHDEGKEGMNKLQTYEEVIALNHKWMDMVAKIAKRYKASAMSVMQMHIEISMAVFVLESGLSPENAREFIADKMRDFEAEARNRVGVATSGA